MELTVTSVTEHHGGSYKNLTTEAILKLKPQGSSAVDSDLTVDCKSKNYKTIIWSSARNASILGIRMSAVLTAETMLQAPS